jgi:hypothetical protein
MCATMFRVQRNMASSHSVGFLLQIFGYAPEDLCGDSAGFNRKSFIQ